MPIRWEPALDRRALSLLPVPHMPSQPADNVCRHSHLACVLCSISNTGRCHPARPAPHRCSCIMPAAPADLARCPLPRSTSSLRCSTSSSQTSAWLACTTSHTPCGSQCRQQRPSVSSDGSRLACRCTPGSCQQRAAALCAEDASCRAWHHCFACMPTHTLSLAAGTLHMLLVGHANPRLGWKVGQVLMMPCVWCRLRWRAGPQPRVHHAQHDGCVPSHLCSAGGLPHDGPGVCKVRGPAGHAHTAHCVALDIDVLDATACTCRTASQSLCPYVP